MLKLCTTPLVLYALYATHMLMTVCCSPDGSLVFDSSADALRYLDVLCVTIVSGLTAFLHCFQAAHASVFFYPCAIADEVLTCRHSLLYADFNSVSAQLFVTRLVTKLDFGDASLEHACLQQGVCCCSATLLKDIRILAYSGNVTFYVMCLPGASVVPANMEPHMTVDAPRARALTMCPEFCTPPSAMMGTPAALATLPTWYTAVACPRPTAQT